MKAGLFRIASTGLQQYSKQLYIIPGANNIACFINSLISLSIMEGWL